MKCGVIMNREVKKALKIAEKEGYKISLPDLEIGQICRLYDVWDGLYSFNLFEGSYCYDISDDCGIEYVFDFIDYDPFNEKDQDRPLSEVYVKICDIFIF